MLHLMRFVVPAQEGGGGGGVLHSNDQTGKCRALQVIVPGRSRLKLNEVHILSDKPEKRCGFRG